jgi:hypothetical protein
MGRILTERWYVIASSAFTSGGVWQSLADIILSAVCNRIQKPLRLSLRATPLIRMKCAANKEIAVCLFS